MKKVFLGFFVTTFISSVIFAQSVPYGNNPAAGRYYTVRGIKMYTETYGKGKPLLMIHGNGGSIDNFTAIIPFFSKKYTVIAVDSRAQGKSIDGGDSLSFEMMADDFAALLDIMHIDSSYVIGWSDGGINALILAMHHPEKVIKLVSTGANMKPDSTVFNFSDWKNQVEYYKSNKNKSFATQKEKNDWKLFRLDFLEPQVQLTDLRIIKCPSLIVCGDHDLITIEHTTAIYKNIQLAYLWVVPNSGHGTLIEHSSDFNQIVDNFFTIPYKKP